MSDATGLNPLGIRPMTEDDLDELIEIDGTIDSESYLHVAAPDGEREDALRFGWSLEPRGLSERRIEANRLDAKSGPGSETMFDYRQTVRGVQEGVALIVEASGQPAGALLARHDPARRLLLLDDVRVDYDLRREGFGSALLYHLIGLGRQRAADQADARLIVAPVPAYNVPAAGLLARIDFQPSGIDTMRQSNHDLVKEAATVLWAFSLE